MTYFVTWWDDRNRNPAQDLADFMQELSQEIWDAMWHTGLEDSCWDAVNGRDKFNKFTPEQVTKLKALSEACGGWIECIEHSEHGIVFVPLSEWKARHL